MAWWVLTSGWRSSLRPVLACALTLVAVITPWAARISQPDGKFVFVSANAGSNLHQGNNACVVDFLDRGWDAQWVDCLASPPPGLDAVDRDRWHLRQASAYLRDHPQEWPRLAAVKLSALWNPELRPSGIPPQVAADDLARLYHSPDFDPGRMLHRLYLTPLLVLAAAGLVGAVRERRPVGALLAVPLAVTLTYVVFHPSTRYRAPADPFVFIFAAIAWARAWAAVFRRRGHSA